MGARLKEYINHSKSLVSLDTKFWPIQASGHFYTGAHGNTSHQISCAPYLPCHRKEEDP